MPAGERAETQESGPEDITPCRDVAQDNSRSVSPRLDQWTLISARHQSLKLREILPGIAVIRRNLQRPLELCARFGKFALHRENPSQQVARLGVIRS
jgi:hypothetical protein